MQDLKISLSAARINAGMTQTEAANAMNVTPQTILAWEKGRVEPRISQARKLAEIYAVPLSCLFFAEQIQNN